MRIFAPIFARSMGLAAATLATTLALAAPATASEPRAYHAAVLRVERLGRMPVSRLDLPPPDLGFAGARLATQDNATTGAFMGQTFQTDEIRTTPDTLAADTAKLLEAGVQWIVVVGQGADVVAVADQAGEKALVFNATAPDDELRGANCRANTLHIAPSDAMLTDALAQYLVWKRWNDWFLVEGSHDQDLALSAAWLRAADKFGARITETRRYVDTGGARSTDSGHTQVQAQLPVFTQNAADHHVVLTADHSGVFADWLAWHTWEARPVAGSAGIVPTAWHPAHEAWGATQWQSRFETQAQRFARPEDFQVWTALRVIGEAATRTKGGDFAALRAYILSPEFNLAAFKGQKLTFRSWDGQLRQPILLAAGKIVTSVSPQAEFLHQVSHLDTLGIDQPESACQLSR